MDKSNIAFGLIIAIIGLYIVVALLLSRVRESRSAKTERRKPADPKRKAEPNHKGSGPWTSFSS